MFSWHGKRVSRPVESAYSSISTVNGDEAKGVCVCVLVLQMLEVQLLDCFRSLSQKRNLK